MILAYVEGTIRQSRTPKELKLRARNLIEFWSDKNFSDVGEDTCQEYAEWRGKLPSARRELQDLASAINRAHRLKLCRERHAVIAPKKGRSRQDYLTRNQVTALIWHFYKTREIQHGKPTKRFPLRHIVPFVLTAVYTGTRSRWIWQASSVQEEGRP